jgi:hypothetical protein
MQHLTTTAAATAAAAAAGTSDVMHSGITVVLHASRGHVHMPM